jgi:ornithine cyclodeaminase/alanine dehydrogenase-like protein (mu-crystallin family)
VADALLLTEEDVRRVILEPGATRSAIDAFERAFAEYGRGAFASPPRVHVGDGDERSGRALRVLPCIAPTAGGAACRVYTMDKEASAEAPAPCELILLFDEHSLELRAVIEDYSLHALRTAAPSAVAIRHLARGEIRTVAVIGSGRQARGQLAAAASVCSPDQVRVYSRDADRRAAFAAEMTAALGQPVLAAASAEEALLGADLVLVATNAAAPAVERRWLAAGALVVSIAPGELADDVVLGSQLVACAAEEVLAGTPRWEPVRRLVDTEELSPAALTVELGHVVAGTKTLARSPQDITVFLSTGMAFWDVVAAAWVDERARRLGIGMPIWPGGGARTGDGFVAPRVDRLSLKGVTGA